MAAPGHRGGDSLPNSSVFPLVKPKAKGRERGSMAFLFSLLLSSPSPLVAVLFLRKRNSKRPKGKREEQERAANKAPSFQSHRRGREEGTTVQWKRVGERISLLSPFSLWEREDRANQEILSNKQTPFVF
jgi:hypothetical protein